MNASRTRFEEQLRGVEQIFEEALDRIDNAHDVANLIPAEVRHNALEDRFSVNFDEAVQYGDKYSRCVSFLNTVCASLSSQQVGDISTEQADALRRVYRFVTGPVRECAYGIDPETHSDISKVQIKRMEAEMHQMASLARDVKLINSEHTYS